MTHPVSALANRPKRGLDPGRALEKWSDDGLFAQLVRLAQAVAPPTAERAPAIIKDAGVLRQYESCRARAERVFHEKLSDALIIGSGIPVGGSGRMPIDPSLWDLLEVDYDHFDAIGEDHQFKALEFFELSAVPLNIRTVPKWLDELLGQNGYNAFRHASDYRHVSLRGISYALAPQLAKIVEFLHKAYLEDGHGWRNGKRILESAGSAQLKMSDVLKDRKDGRALIESDGKGMYRLALGPLPGTSETP